MQVSRKPMTQNSGKENIVATRVSRKILIYLLSLEYNLK